MMRTLVVTFLFLAPVAASHGRAGSVPVHFELSRSAPEAYATVDSVSEIRLWFTEVPAEKTTSIRVVNAADVAVPTGAVVQDPRNGRVVSASLLTGLAPDRYTVSWRARGPDGHEASGYFAFTVATP